MSDLAGCVGPTVTAALMNEWISTNAEAEGLLMTFDSAPASEKLAIDGRRDAALRRLYGVEDRISATPGDGRAFTALKLKIFLERARVSEIDDDPIFGMVRSALCDLESATGRRSSPELVA